MLVYSDYEAWYNNNADIIITKETRNRATREIVNLDITLEEWQLIVSHRKWKGANHTSSSPHLKNSKIVDNNHNTVKRQNVYAHHTTAALSDNKQSTDCEISFPAPHR